MGIEAMATKHLIIPGIAKAGTTFLFDQLIKSSDIFNVPVYKEINFFSLKRGESKIAYLKNFPDHNPDKIYVDASPTYLNNPIASIPRLNQVLANDEVKFLVCLRNPIETLFSHYLHDLKSNVGRLRVRRKPRTFELFSVESLKRYFRARSIGVQGLVEEYGHEAVIGIHMWELFTLAGYKRIKKFIGEDIQAFDCGKVSNPGGWVPYYIYGGKSGSDYYQGGKIYRIPPYALVYVNNERSEILHDVEEEWARNLVLLASTFTNEIVLPKEAFQPIIDDYNASCNFLGLSAEDMSEYGKEIHFEAGKPHLPTNILQCLSNRGTIISRTKRIYKDSVNEFLSIESKK